MVAAGARHAVTNPPAWIVVSHVLLPNGAAHRLVTTLQARARPVVFCGLPLPWGRRRRAEQLLPPSLESTPSVDKPGPVRLWEELNGVGDLARFGRQVASLPFDRFVLVGCDPLGYAEARFVLADLRRRIRRTVWFVDWSAQRLEHPVTGRAYQALTRFALRDAHEAAAISPAAASALGALSPGRATVRVVPNQPLHLGALPSWEERPAGVGYLEGLSLVQGSDLLVGIAQTLAAEEISLAIAGDGPASSDIQHAVGTLPGVRFHGLVERPSAIRPILASARVGVALYDPAYPMHSCNDPLKVKDYLASGMRVVTTLPRLADGDIVRSADYSLGPLLDEIRRVLRAPPPATGPQCHPLLREAAGPVEEFIDAPEESA